MNSDPTGSDHKLSEDVCQHWITDCSYLLSKICLLVEGTFVHKFECIEYLRGPKTISSLSTHAHLPALRASYILIIADVAFAFTEEPCVPECSGSSMGRPCGLTRVAAALRETFCIHSNSTIHLIGLCSDSQDLLFPCDLPSSLNGDGFVRA
ncbi:hypothetical protein EJ02DRAFT_453803, partial [Clathrospora elynae]